MAWNAKEAAKAKLLRAILQDQHISLDRIIKIIQRRSTFLFSLELFAAVHDKIKEPWSQQTEFLDRRPRLALTKNKG